MCVDEFEVGVGAEAGLGAEVGEGAEAGLGAEVGLGAEAGLNTDFIDLDVQNKFYYLVQKEQKLTSKFIWNAYCRRRNKLYN